MKKLLAFLATALCISETGRATAQSAPTLNIPIQITSGAGYAPAFDTWLFLDPQFNNPSVGTEALYAQDRLTGDAHNTTHDGLASELFLVSVTNSGFANAYEGTVSFYGTENISDARGMTANTTFDNSFQGTVASLSFYRAQTVPALATGQHITNLYNFYSEPQTAATNNYDFYGSGTSTLGQLNLSSGLSLTTGLPNQISFNNSSGFTLANIYVNSANDSLNILKTAGTGPLQISSNSAIELTATSLSINGSTAVSCSAGTVSLSTLVVTNGVITHC